MNLKTLSRTFVYLAVLAVSACSNPDTVDNPGPGDSVNTCAEAACDANATCDTSSGHAVCTCKAGYSGNGKTCADVDECATHADNCSDNATCTNTPGGFTCACEPGYSGNGVTCTARTGRVLVFADAAGTTTQPPAAAAAVSLDMTVTVARTEQSFVEAFDTGGFEVVVVESETVPFPANVQSRLTGWIQGGGKALVAHPALHQLTALQDLLEVDAASPYTSWRDVYVAQDVVPNLFEQHQRLASPLALGTAGTGRGVQLTPRGSGLKLAALGSATGVGAIVATRGQRVLVHGFRASDVAQVDKDTDGVPDVQELYVNELLYLLNPHVLVYDDFPGGGRLSATAVTQLKMTAFYTSDSTQFSTVYDRGGFQVLVVESGAKDMPVQVDVRVTSWVEADNRLIFSGGALNQIYNLRQALGLSTVTLTKERQVYAAAPSSAQNLFALRETFPSPISGHTTSSDYGDELTVIDSLKGFIAARFDSATGPGAIAVTRQGKAITNGFLLLQMYLDDEDGDGKPDVQELIVNELVYLGLP